MPGINFKKHLEIEFNPTPLKSLELIFERWSRFGKFGIKHKVQRRDVDDIINLNDRLTKESTKKNLQVLPVKTEFVSILPPPAQNVLSVSAGKPLVATEETLSDPLDNSVIIPVVETLNEITPPLQPFLTVSGEPNVILTVPVSTTTTAPVTINVPPVQAAQNLTSTSPGLYTNILQTLNSFPVREVNRENLSIPATNLENQNFIIRGSRFAMYFGSMLLRMLSQYLSGGRVAFANIPGQEVAPL